MKRVLIVEDDQAYRELLKETLEKNGYEAVPAENGDKGLEYLTNNDADLILLDIKMPGTDGIMFMYHLHHSLMKKIPIVVLTNLDQATYQPEVQDFLLKANTSLDEVVDRIKNYIH